MYLPSRLAKIISENLFWKNIVFRFLENAFLQSLCPWHYLVINQPSTVDPSPPFTLKFVQKKFNQICPKKPAPSILYGGRLYGFAALENHVRVCAPSIFARR